MIKLNSFSEIEVPVGLFPSDTAFYLESIASRTVNYLAGLSLEEVNVSLVYVRHMMRMMSDMGKDEAISGEVSNVVKKHINRVDRFVPPDEEVVSDVLMMQFLDKKFFNNSEKFLREDVNGNNTVENVLELHKKMYGSISLYYYLLGLKVGRRENRKNNSENNQFYRLGKASPYFFSSSNILDILSQMQGQVSAVAKKEKHTQEKKKETSSKGGKKRVSKYAPLKEKIFRMYDEKYSGCSNREAAIQICKKLDKADLSILITPYPQETIAKWIGQRLRLTEK